MKKPLKWIGVLLALIISPMIFAALASAVFLTIRLARGDSFSLAWQALTALFSQILPFLPYLTGIPAVLVAAALLVRRKRI